MDAMDDNPYMDQNGIWRCRDEKCAKYEFDKNSIRKHYFRVHSELSRCEGCLKTCDTKPWDHQKSCRGYKWYQYYHQKLNEIEELKQECINIEKLTQGVIKRMDKMSASTTLFPKNGTASQPKENAVSSSTSKLELYEELNPGATQSSTSTQSTQDTNYDDPDLDDNVTDHDKTDRPNKDGDEVSVELDVAPAIEPTMFQRIRGLWFSAKKD